MDMEKHRYLTLLEKYKQDKRSLCFLEECQLINLNKKYLNCSSIYHLSEEEIKDISSGRVSDLIDTTKQLTKELKEKKGKKKDKKLPWDTRGWDPDPNKDRRNIIG